VAAVTVNSFALSSYPFQSGHPIFRGRTGI